MKTLPSLHGLLLAAALLCAGPVLAAEVRVMISAGFYGAYSELVPAFEKASGHKVVTTRGPSMGDSPEAIPARIGRGEGVDVVIMDGKAIDDLAKKGQVQGDTKVEIARSQIGMVVKAGAPKPDISTPDAFKKTLLSAKSIAYSDSSSGTYLSTVLFQQLGVWEQVQSKSRKVRGPPSGEPVAAVVARGDAEIGFQQVSELMHVPGIDLVGPIPSELQSRVAFSGVLANSVENADAARALIAFLSSPSAAGAITRAGLAPIR